MIQTGLVSVTFRKLSPREIVDIVKKAKLDGIEWGGDIHVPCGDIKKAREVKALTENEGIKIASYGSYYKTAVSENSGLSFLSVLETAKALGAPAIRVWAGNKGSLSTDSALYNKIAEDSRRIADMASKENIIVAYEYHPDTLTDTNESALKLLKDVNHNNMKTYWQYPTDKSFDYCTTGLKSILNYLANIHVYYYSSNGKERMLLESGKDMWTKFLNIVKPALEAVPGVHFAMLEFVKEDNVENFLKDAAALKELVR